DGVLHVRISGQFPDERFAKLENGFQGIIDACLAHKCNKLLIDSRELQANFSTTQLYTAGVDAVNLTTAGLSVAIVTRTDLHDTFFDDVVANRGGKIGIFTDMKAARDWLHINPTDTPTQPPRLATTSWRPNKSIHGNKSRS